MGSGKFSLRKGTITNGLKKKKGNTYEGMVREINILLILIFFNFFLNFF